MLRGMAEIVCGGDGHAPKEGMAMGMLLMLGSECVNSSEITSQYNVNRCKNVLGMAADMLRALDEEWGHPPICNVSGPLSP